MRMLQARFKPIPALLIAVFVWPTAAAAERLQMPYRCEARGGEVRLLPSSGNSYPILGRRESRLFTACSPADASRCRNWMVHRFEIDCDGVSVPWTDVVAAGSRYGRIPAWNERGRMLLDMGPGWAGDEEWRERPFRGRRWWYEGRSPDVDDEYGGDRSGYGAGRERGGSTVALPPGFAPRLGIPIEFVPGDGPARVAGDRYGGSGEPRGYANDDGRGARGGRTPFEFKEPPPSQDEITRDALARDDADRHGGGPRDTDRRDRLEARDAEGPHADEREGDRDHRSASLDDPAPAKGSKPAVKGAVDKSADKSAVEKGPQGKAERTAESRADAKVADNKPSAPASPPAPPPARGGDTAKAAPAPAEPSAVKPAAAKPAEPPTPSGPIGVTIINRPGEKGATAKSSSMDVAAGAGADATSNATTTPPAPVPATRPETVGDTPPAPSADTPPSPAAISTGSVSEVRPWFQDPLTLAGIVGSLALLATAFAAWSRRGGGATGPGINRDLASVSFAGEVPPARSLVTRAGSAKAERREPALTVSAVPSVPAASAENAEKTVEAAEPADPVADALERLGIDTDTPLKVVKTIVDGLRKSWHPDLASSDEERLYREQRLAEINAAWDVIAKQRPAA